MNNVPRPSGTETMVQRCAEGDDKHFRGGDIWPYSGCAADTHFTTAVPTATALTDFCSGRMVSIILAASAAAPGGETLRVPPAVAIDKLLPWLVLNQSSAVLVSCLLLV